MKAFALDGIVGMAAKRLTKRAIRDIVETVIVVRLWMAAVLLTGPNLPLLSWSFRAAGVAGANDFKSIHALRQNINTVAMLTSDALLRHFSKGMYHAGNRRLHTLISYVLLVLYVEVPQHPNFIPM